MGATPATTYDLIQVNPVTTQSMVVKTLGLTVDTTTRFFADGGNLYWVGGDKVRRTSLGPGTVSTIAGIQGGVRGILGFDSSKVIWGATTFGHLRTVAK
jgi:hypothetical protein